jgi:hypothetical protein
MSTNKLNYAICRRVSKTICEGLTTVDLGSVDYEKAVIQHEVNLIILIIKIKKN